MSAFRVHHGAACRRLFGFGHNRRQRLSLRIRTDRERAQRLVRVFPSRIRPLRFFFILRTNLWRRGHGHLAPWTLPDALLGPDTSV